MILLLAGTAAAITRDEVLARAQAWVDAGVMYSYDAWYTDPTSGECCYRTDCSGFVSAVWGIDPPGNTTYSFAGGPWDDGSTYVIDASELQPGDALNYPGDVSEGTGHVMLYVDGDFSSGWVEVYEEYSHGEPATFRWRSIDTSLYLPMRYEGIEDCSDEVCDGLDNDCDGVADDGWVCETPEQPALAAWRYDARPDTDVDGDGRADLCARGSAGVYCSLSSGAAFSTLPVYDGFANAAGFSELGAYSTLRFADVDGDGRADACGRSPTLGWQCALSTGTGFGTVIEGPEMSDANGWSDPLNYTTLRMGDVDGDGRTDLCGRGDAGMYCWLSDGTGFPTVLTGPTWSDGLGWDDAMYASTIRMADVDGDGRDDLCARSSTGFDCWLSDGAGFPTEVLGPALSNAANWDETEYYQTLAMPDVNGDGRADVCARGTAGVYCWLSEGTSFSDAIAGPPLSDGAGWNSFPYWASLRWGDYTGDGMDDLCARGAAGMFCWPSTGTGFGDHVSGPVWSDAMGWSDYSNAATIDLADVDADGRADLCGRADAGELCWLSDGSSFPTEVVGPGWDDTNGWSAQQYYGTFRIAGGRLLGTDTATSDPGTGGGGGASDTGGGTEDSGTPKAHAEGGGVDTGGCGCASSGPATSWGLAALAGVVGLRRRARA